jgi:hypothetical protein
MSRWVEDYKETPRGEARERVPPYPTIPAGQDICATTTSSTTKLQQNISKFRAISTLDRVSVHEYRQHSPPHNLECNARPATQPGGVGFSKVHNEGKATTRETVDYQYILRRVGYPGCTQMDTGIRGGDMRCQTGIPALLDVHRNRIIGGREGVPNLGSISGRIQMIPLPHPLPT